MPSARAGAAAAHGRRPPAPPGQRRVRGPLRPGAAGIAGRRRRRQRSARLGAGLGWAGAAGAEPNGPGTGTKGRSAACRPGTGTDDPGLAPGSAPTHPTADPCWKDAAPPQLAPALINVASREDRSQLIYLTHPPKKKKKRKKARQPRRATSGTVGCGHGRTDRLPAPLPRRSPPSGSLASASTHQNSQLSCSQELLKHRCRPGRRHRPGTVVAPEQL